MIFHEHKSIKFLQSNINKMVYESKWSDKISFGNFVGIRN